MTDAELVKAVALRLEWTEIKKDSTSYGLDSLGIDPNGVERWYPPWRTSVDAALAVRDEGWHFTINWLPKLKQWEVIYKPFFLAAVQNTQRDESLPRAILLAFLDSPKEKP